MLFTTHRLKEQGNGVLSLFVRRSFFHRFFGEVHEPQIWDLRSTITHPLAFVGRVVCPRDGGVL